MLKFQIQNIIHQHKNKRIFFGNSVGEITALVSSEMISLETGLEIISTRSRLMENFFTNLLKNQPSGQMGMCFVKTKFPVSDIFWNDLESEFNCEVSINASPVSKFFSGKLEDIQKVGEFTTLFLIYGIYWLQ